MQCQPAIPAIQCSYQVKGDILNSSGQTITWVGKHVWHGSPDIKCNSEIIEGQTGAFIHNGHGKVSGALVFRVPEKCDVMMSWSASPTTPKKVYTEIREIKHFQGPVWDDIDVMLEKSGPMCEDQNKGYIAVLRINDDASVYATIKKVVP